MADICFVCAGAGWDVEDGGEFPNGYTFVCSCKRKFVRVDHIWKFKRLVFNRYTLFIPLLIIAAVLTMALLILIAG